MRGAARAAIVGAIGVLLVGAGTVEARPARVSVLQIPQVFRPVAYKFSSSRIPVFVPTWLPKFPMKVYGDFMVFGKIPGYGGPGYGLSVYDSPTARAHASEIGGITGIAGDWYKVGTHTRPVHLGKQGWAYIDPNLIGNQGYTITVVRSYTPNVVAQEYTYWVDRMCGSYGTPVAQVFSCLEHVARSLARYTSTVVR
jgi:hypothetical protein